MSSVFVVAATVLTIVSGVPVHPFNDGDIRYDVTHRFPTMEACQEHLNSDRFKLEQQELASMIVSRYDADHVPKITIVPKCHEFIPGGPDGKMRDKTAEEKGTF